MADVLVLKDVEKNYGGLRPLRVRALSVAEADVVMLVGFDKAAAEVFVSLATGSAVPDRGIVMSLGRDTAAIADSDDWLSFVERFGIVSDRIVLLEAMTVAQNLAISYGLALDPVPGEVMARVEPLALEVGIDAAVLARSVADAGGLVRTRVHLARALAFDPSVLLLEHPTAALSPEEGAAFAATVKDVAARRRLTTIGLVMDERFARSTGGRLLIWPAATGDLRERSKLRFW